jgi:YHS domain-containing protein
VAGRAQGIAYTYTPYGYNIGWVGVLIAVGGSLREAFFMFYWLHRDRERLGWHGGLVQDPVCGMQVDPEHPGAVLRDGGPVTYFCSGHCLERYRAGDRSRA